MGYYLLSQHPFALRSSSDNRTKTWIGNVVSVQNAISIQVPIYIPAKGSVVSEPIYYPMDVDRPTGRNEITIYDIITHLYVFYFETPIDTSFIETLDCPSILRTFSDYKDEIHTWYDFMVYQCNYCGIDNGFFVKNIVSVEDDPDNYLVEIVYKKLNVLTPPLPPTRTPLITVEQTATIEQPNNRISTETNEPAKNIETTPPIVVKKPATRRKRTLANDTGSAAIALKKPRKDTQTAFEDIGNIIHTLEDRENPIYILCAQCCRLMTFKNSDDLVKSRRQCRNQKCKKPMVGANKGTFYVFREEPSACHS